MMKNNKKKKKQRDKDELEKDTRKWVFRVKL